MPDVSTRSPRPWGALLRSRRTHALLSLGLVACLATGGTWASWSDSATITGTTLTTGKLDLKVNEADNPTSSIGLSYPAMYPGATSAGVLVVKNNGTVPFTYTMTASATNEDTKNLMGSLVAKVATGTSSGPTLPSTCTGPTVAGSGTSFSGTLIGPTIKRTVAANGGTDTLCVQATLPAGALNGLQEATTAVTFTIAAEQAP